ncbi:bifunctional protein-serine/threonine kinase/phosphatase [Propionivibrio sp.]|uniref:bifunctional protein-serine/threonine kinase/phosphatase n=1 Tax=Propionivibrio sp. TaxID=2212460 RepID=UPI0025F78416|nr:bifunctional protein-serine/threonine kinase/phosphatase [Propionivibrio sp.]MBK7354868.1 bifunctional protein-serine/threonine kinase/phosphatase [Propionivibrio sp.]MBK8402236.1 bifunctional protein-serine/threonine kinase/phosphatase [Propionivibrio sp.]MBK8745926.1 bifunctional protein-serine/threonine kinase/phosphatase [Propionivibrio sp.]MBK8892693.1 bifunctional protein-serine/threonine kinase/phosphatase [Propionivibrio sp.]MBL0207419.1 bifunctional protein-serine/threonine kinase/
MTSQLRLSVGQYSDKGRKASNQDFHGVYIPKEPQLSSKGIAIAVADGISSSEVSHIASQSAVTGFLEDYYCTSEAWSVKTSAERVLVATNSWLHAQTQQGQYRYDKDRGYVCTLSVMVIKSATAHIFHVGDSRIYQLRDGVFEQLTHDHRVWVSPDQSYLSRAMGINPQLEIDYRTLQVEEGDIYVLSTDGVYEFADANCILASISCCGGDLDQAARSIAEQAYRQGSPDNLTVQIVRVEELPSPEANEIFRQLSELPFAPLLDARAIFDGYQIIRELHASSRSHIYLAVDGETQQKVVIKTPSIDLQEDPAYLERFLMEEWIARRINCAHVLKPCLQTRKRNFIYVATEYIEGQTLAQWMLDNPKPELDTVRRFIDQIAKGLQAFHRLEMLHQDLKPDNVMIDHTGTLKIIDFGATRVAGMMEIASPIEQINLLGAAQYAAPEYFLGESGSSRSDIFSLGIIAYQMLSGKLPYGVAVPKSRTRAAQRKLVYESVLRDDREIPAWIDEAIKKAVHPDPFKRYGELSEFIYDLHHPNSAFLNKTRAPLIERHPVLFWKAVSFLLMLALIVVLSIKTTGT